MPSAARKACCVPSTVAVRRTSAVSRPGVSVSSVAARVKARRLSAMDMVRGFPVLDGGTVAVSGGGIQQGNEAGLDSIGQYLQDRQRDRQLETTRACAARVGVETVTTP